MQGLTPKEIYALSTSQQLGGVQGYHVDKKYFDPLKQIQQREALKIKKGEKSRKHVTKRGNFLDDEANTHKAVPGPGHYSRTEQLKKEAKPKIRYADKMTYLDQIIKQQKKEKIPAPGEYNVVKTLKEQENEAKRLAAKKAPGAERISYLDQVQYEATQTPGVGSYNPRKRAHTEVVLSNSHSRIKPEEWIKKHSMLQRKQPPKTPDMTTYTPTIGNSALFDNISKLKHNKNFLGKVDRFKTSSSGSGVNPDKYAIVQEWRGKDKKKIERHGLEAISRPATTLKSVYYH